VLGGVDFSHLHRFKASLGLALVIAAVGLPWLVLRDDSALSISQDDLDSLTTTAKGIVEQKQRHYEMLQEALPYLSLTLLVGGIVLLVQGIRGWKEIQEVLDRRERAGTALQEHEVRVTTLTENERLVDDVRKAEEDLAVTDEPAPPGVAPIDSAAQKSDGAAPSTHAWPGRTMTHTRSSLRNSVVQQRQIELLANSKLAGAFKDTHTLERDVVIRTEVGVRATCDMLLRPKRPLSQTIACDVYFVTSEQAFVKNAPNRLGALALFGDLYERSGEAVRCVMLIVFDFDRSLQLRSSLSAFSRLRLRAYRYGDVYPGVHTLITDERALAEADLAELRAFVGDGYYGDFLGPFGGQLTLPLDWSGTGGPNDLPSERDLQEVGS
jgi:hypothetical protein